MGAQQVSSVVDQMLGEWKRGMLNFWALSLLLTHPMYGLEIKKEIETSTQGKMKLGASTIYQLLRRLEKRGLVASRWESTRQGPPRAYYQVTEAGAAVVRRYVAEVLSPDSPIFSALGALTGRLCNILPERTGQWRCKHGQGDENDAESDPKGDGAPVVRRYPRAVQGEVVRAGRDAVHGLPGGEQGGRGEDVRQQPAG
jgi:PadR family transcriptional regulator PadR